MRRFEFNLSNWSELMAFDWVLPSWAEWSLQSRPLMSSMVPGARQLIGDVGPALVKLMQWLYSNEEAMRRHGQVNSTWLLFRM